MTVRIAPFKGRKEQWEVDIRFEWPDGTRYRERRLAPTSSRSGAKRWGEQRERELLSRGKPNEKEDTKKQTPTLQFWPRFLEEHCEAERLKPSTTHHRRTHVASDASDADAWGRAQCVSRQSVASTWSSFARAPSSTAGR